MTGLQVIDALKKKFRTATDAALAEKLGMTTQGIQIWKKRRRPTAANIARLTHCAQNAGAKLLQASAIRPLVEFFPISKSLVRERSDNFQVFSHLEKGQIHPYRKGLKDELSEHQGVYIFFDSRGQAIYAGRTSKQSLWKEINLVFNRDRDTVQKIKRVSHPNRKTIYRTSDEKTRQIQDVVVRLHELAAYFSAYHVADSMIGDLEALLVRSFANDLLNIRMEQFSRQRRKKTK